MVAVRVGTKGGRCAGRCAANHAARHPPLARGARSGASLGRLLVVTIINAASIIYALSIVT